MSSKTILLMLYLLLLLLWSGLLRAQPDLNNAREANGISFFKDLQQQNLYYYLPGHLELGQSEEGKPDISFILMRYAGSSTTSDADLAPRFRNILTLRLLMKEIGADSLAKARRLLQSQVGNVRLNPMPLSQVEAMVVFTPIGMPDTARVVQRGEMATESAAGYTTSATFWRERYFTLFLDNHSAGLLLEAFNKNLTAISFTYAFYTRGATEKRVLDISGYGRLDSTLQQQFKGLVADNADTTLRECIVKSDAFPIQIDTARYPDLIRKIDINDAVPPGYAVINVRNYDFANNLRTDLYEKTVELEATGAGGDPVNLSVRFNIKNRDVTSTNFRFRYAVRLDKPYRYRVRDLLKDGRELVTDWKIMTAWSFLLDVTTRPESPSQ